MVEPPEHEVELVAQPPQLLGVWADLILVTYGVGGCTFDFLREDSLIPARLILVARVTVSSHEAHRLMAEIDAAITAYAQASFGEELDGHPQSQTDSDPEQ